MTNRSFSRLNRPKGCSTAFSLPPRLGVICKAMPQAHRRNSVLGAQQGALIPPLWQENLADILARA